MSKLGHPSRTSLAEANNHNQHSHPSSMLLAKANHHNLS